MSRDEVAFVGNALFNVMSWNVFPPFAIDISELLNTPEKLVAQAAGHFIGVTASPFFSGN